MNGWMRIHSVWWSSCVSVRTNQVPDGRVAAPERTNVKRIVRTMAMPVIHAVLKCVQTHQADRGLQDSAERTIGFMMMH